MYKKFVTLTLGALLLLGLQSAQAFESHLKLRVHRDVVMNGFTKNFGLLMEKVEKEQEKDVRLDDIRSTMTDVQVGIRPIRGMQWSEMQTLETIFDDNQIIIEGHELEFQGSGLIKDPQTGAQEKIGFHAPMSTCQIVLSLGEEYASWGSLYPRFNIDQVLFQIDESLITVSAFGDLPLFKSHSFEKSVKKWFVSQINKRQTEFKNSLQAVEKNLWKNLPLSQKIFMNLVTLNTSLTEPMQIKGDHIYSSFINEFDNTVETDFEESLVTVKPEFANSNEFRKDVQLTFDENLINNQLVGLFNSNKVISLQETVISWLPDQFQTYATLVSQFFTSTWFGKVFPDIVNEFGHNKRLDVKCGFSKQFLQGKLADKHTSQVWFKEGDIIEFAANFGCGVFVGGVAEQNPMELFQTVIKAINKIPEDKKQKSFSDDWANFRSFYVSATGSAQLSFFSASYFGMENIMQGSLKNFDFKIRDLKVYKGSGQNMREMISEEKTYNDKFLSIKNLIENTPLTEYAKKIPFLQGIPLSPFPRYQRCLGVTPHNGNVKVHDRYIQVAFDLKMSQADEKCLYSNFEEPSFIPKRPLNLIEGYEQIAKKLGINK